MLDLTRLLRVPQVQPQFDISPDDLKLAFAWNRTGEWQIYEMLLSASRAERIDSKVEAGKTSQHTSVKGGKFNPRCPASDSIDARDKLVELGKDVELLLYEDEGHAFLKIENIIDSELKRVEFLAKHLGG